MAPSHSSSTHTPPARSGRGWLLRLGEWCARHCVVVIVLWVVALGGLHALQSAFGGTYSDDFSLPGTQSNTGAELLKAHDPAAGGTGAQVVLHDAQKQLTEVQSQVDQAVANLQKLPHVLSAQNPLPSSSSASSTSLSKDGKTGYITVRFDVNPTSLDDSYLDQVDTAVKPLRSMRRAGRVRGAAGRARQARDQGPHQ